LLPPLLPLVLDTPFLYSLRNGKRLGPQRVAVLFLEALGTFGQSVALRNDMWEANRTQVAAAAVAAAFVLL
jgi:hypothetical protein